MNCAEFHIPDECHVHWVIDVCIVVVIGQGSLQKVVEINGL